MTLYDLDTRMTDLIDGLNVCQREEFAKHGYVHEPDKWHIGRKGTKFLHLNCGGSGAFLVEIATGELYNIKAYGVPDHNKKKKADIGNVFSVDASKLFTLRYNYLR